MPLFGNKPFDQVSLERRRLFVGLEVATPVQADDTGVGTDAVILAALYTLAESSTGADSFIVAAQGAFADSGVGADSSLLAAIFSASDAGTGTDTPALAALYSLADSAAGVDAFVVAIAQVFAETGTGVDAVSLAAAISAAETGAGVDTPAATDGSYRRQVMLDSPTAYWRLDEASGTVAADASGNGKTGTYGGTYTQAVAGLLTSDSDKAVQLTDTGVAGTRGRVDLPTDVAHVTNAAESLGIELSFKLSAVNAVLFSARKNGASGPVIDITIGANGNDNAGTGRPSILVRNVDGTGLLTLSGPAALNDNQRHHLVVTRDGSDAKWRIYVDGQLVATSAADAITSIVGLDWTAIGRDIFNAALATLDGIVDEVSVYQGGGVLDQTLITSHYKAWFEGGFVANDTATGTDTVSLKAFPTSADAGTGADGSSLVVSASGADTGTGTDTPSLAAALSSSDAGAGADSFTVFTPGVPTFSEAGSGVDSFTVTVQVSVADSPTVTDTPSIAFSTTVADVGAGADAVSAVGKMTVSDTAGGSDTFAMPKALISIADTPTVTDLATLNPVSYSFGDSGIGTDNFARSQGIQLVVTQPLSGRIGPTSPSGVIERGSRGRIERRVK